MVNKPKSVVLIAVLFMVIVLFSGCTNKDTAEEVTTNSEGTEGIVSEFMPGAPPDQVAEDEIFEATVMINNKGEYVVPQKDIALFLLGVNPASIGLDTGLVMMDYLTCSGDCLADVGGIESAHLINGEWIPGGYDYITWTNSTGGGLEYAVPINSDQNLNFVAQTCYYYETRSVSDACFSDNPYAQTTGSETCDVSGDKFVSNSGAPIHITKVTENPSGKSKYTFTFQIENVGEGRAFSPDVALDSCTALKQSALDRVTVTDVLVGGQPGACSTIGKKVLLVDGVGQFTCRVEAPNIVGDYSDIIEVVLTYGYYDQITKQITVLNVLE